MSDQPAYSCGDAFCCGGTEYPACQLPPTKGARININVAGNLNVTHHDDTATGPDVFPCSD